MKQPLDKTASELDLHEITQRLREKVKRGDYTAADLDEYLNVSSKLIATKEDFYAGMDIIQDHLDKLTAMMAQAIESISAEHQQHVKASPPEG